jgi:hypothetical protein
VILRLLEDEGWSGVWVNHVNRGPFPRRWTPSPVRIFPPRTLLDLLDRIYTRSGKRSGAFDVLAWADDDVLFTEAKRGGKDALRRSQKTWIEAALDEGVPLGSLLVVEWGFGGVAEGEVGSRAPAGVASGLRVPGTRSGGSPPRGGMSATPPQLDPTRPDDKLPESSRLASEGVTGPSPEDPQVFFDSYDSDAHGRFLGWRERNRRGYVISRRSPSDAMLHRAYCGHFEHGEKSASLTRTMKVCSQHKGELEAWARENLRASPKRCRSCM